MGIPSLQLIKFVISGPISSSDTWSVGLWCEQSNPMAQADLDGFAAGCLTSFKSKFWSAASQPWSRQVSTVCSVTTCKAYLYSGGVLALQSQATQAAVAGTGTSPHPAYTAAVFSLLTASFGRRRRGRLYLPFTGGTVSPASDDMTVLAQDVTNMRSWLEDGLTGAWNASFGGGVTPAVVSQVGPGSTAHITHLRLDSKPDTQRGRQSKTVPGNTFTSAAL